MRSYGHGCRIMLRQAWTARLCRAGGAIPRSTDSLPGYFASYVWTASCGMCNGEFKLVAHEREGRLPLGSFPVWKRSVFNVKGNDMIRLVDGIRAKVTIAPLYRSFVFLRRALALIVGCKLGAAIAQD